MSDAQLKPDLMPALGRLVQGLAALFWGLPLALIVSVQTGRAEWLNAFGPVPMVVVSLLLLFGLRQLSFFQAQERVWRRELDRARLPALVSLGLSPFLYWWYRMPQVEEFDYAVTILAISSLVFLSNLNLVVCQLGAMLPDATLRQEARLFTVLNRSLIAAGLLFLAAGATLRSVDVPLSAEVAYVVVVLFVHLRLWLLGFFVLLPVAMTMALIWKIKETILSSVFHAGGR